MRLSIIVPVYNVEQYLTECIESLLMEQNNDFEVILVDDGSTDSSGTICDKYSQGDKRVRVIHKSNGGLSDARNEGIKNCKGDYIAFVDSDDYISAGSISSIIRSLENEPDVVITRLIDTYPDKEYIRDESLATLSEQMIDKKKAIKWIMCESYNTWPAQKYIVAKKFIEKNELEFKKGYLHEDVDWTCRLCIYGNTFTVNISPWYHHRRVREGSIMNTVNPKGINDVLEIAYSFINGSEHNALDEYLDSEEKEILINRLLNSVYPALRKCKYLDIKGKQIVIDEMNYRLDLFSYKPELKYRPFALAVKTIGAKNAIHLLALI